MVTEENICLCWKAVCQLTYAHLHQVLSLRSTWRASRFNALCMPLHQSKVAVIMETVSEGEPILSLSAHAYRKNTNGTLYSVTRLDERLEAIWMRLRLWARVKGCTRGAEVKIRDWESGMIVVTCISEQTRPVYGGTWLRTGYLVHYVTTSTSSLGPRKAYYSRIQRAGGQASEQ